MSSNFTSTSYSSVSTSSTTNGQTTGSTHTSQTHSNNEGTTVRTTTERIGEPATEDIRHYDARGNQLVNGNGANGQAKIEDVTDADKLYEERMEDEYAKREGGA